MIPIQRGRNLVGLRKFFFHCDLPGTLKFNQNNLTLLTGKGAVRLADAVLRAVEQPVEFKFLYDVEVCL